MTLKEASITDFILLLGQETVAEALAKVRQAGTSSRFVIIKRAEGAQVYFYLYPLKPTLRQLQESPEDLTVAQALQLHEWESSPTLDSSVSVTGLAEDSYVVTRNGEALGYCIITADTIIPKPNAPSPSPTTIDRGLEPEMSGAEPDDDIFTGPDRGAAEEAVPAKMEPNVAPPAFEAYPDISDPGTLEPGQNFEVTVKFSKEADQTLDTTAGTFAVARPEENDFAEVSLMAKGADIEQNQLAKIFLDLKSSATFNCKVQDGAEEVVLYASFYYKKQPMTMATRRLSVQEDAHRPSTPPLPDPDTPSDGCLLNIQGISFEEDAIDVTASVIYDKRAGKLIWDLVSIHDEDTHHIAEVEVDDTRAFARDLGTKLALVKYAGENGGNNLIATLGQQIADLIPNELFTLLRQAYTKIGPQRPPRLLIWTEEPYIPWELAYDVRLQFDGQFDPILALQVSVGRWLKQKRVVYPLPARLDVTTFSAMAGDYSGSYTQAKLEEAIKEKEFLVSQFQATPVEALCKKLLALTSGQPKAGHLLHMALHGVSNPTLNEQLISLQDGDLLAESLMGAYTCGQIPAISFLFLNACQVGTPGDTLGQASGFPGVLLNKGTLGFIAPLWNVHDIFARPFCEQFYQETLGKERPVGDVLLELRRHYREHWAETLTHLAYIYYGHPNLKLINTTKLS